MKVHIHRGRVLLTAVLFLLAAAAAGAQINSAVAGVNLDAKLNPILAVNASPGLVNFLTPPGGIANGDSTITINTRWILAFTPGKPNVDLSLYAYFTNPAAALTNGAGSNIPASRVLGSVNGGAYTAFTTASPFSAASLVVFSRRIKTNQGGGNSQQIDLLNLRIDTSGLGLPAGTYTGVLVIQAQAI